MQITDEKEVMGRNQGMNDDAYERSYQLTCKVKSKTVTRINNESRYEFNLIYLVPEMSDEMIRFYDAFLPDYVLECNNNEHVFLNLKSQRAFRGSLLPANKEINERHIFIMSDDEREFFKNLLKGKREELVRITCLPFSEHGNYNV